MSVSVVRKIHNILRDYFDVIFIFGFVFLALLPKTNNFCNLVVASDFDSQNLLLWDFLGDLNTLPIKDIFFPHGLLFYYSSKNLFIFYIYLIFSPLYFVIIYLSLKRLYKKQKVVSLVLFVLFFVFSTSLLPVRSIVRYGMLLACLVLMALINVSKKLSNWKWLYFGLIAGLAISASEGIGMMILTAGFLFIVADQLFITEHKKTASSQLADELDSDMSFSLGSETPHSQRGENVITTFKLKVLIRSICKYCLGLMLGLIPLVIFLVRNGMVFDYVNWIQEISEISLYAKAPLSLRGRYIIFVFVVLFVHSIYLVALFSQKRKGNILYKNLLVSSFVSILLLMPRYIVRQNNWELIYYETYCVLLFFYPFVLKVRGNSVRVIKLLAFIFIFFISLSLTLSVPLQKTNYFEDIRVGFSQFVQLNDISERLCKLSDFDYNKLGLDRAYFEVSEYINSHFEDIGVFSYPGDPVFYLLLGQKPPPYPTVYEGSTVYAQEKNIEYIENRNVEVVIYNSKAKLVDNIPESVRAPILNSYIYHKYETIETIGEFSLMRRK